MMSFHVLLKFCFFFMNQKVLSHSGDKVALVCEMHVCFVRLDYCILCGFYLVDFDFSEP